MMLNYTVLPGAKIFIEKILYCVPTRFEAMSLQHTSQAVLHFQIPTY